VRRLHESVPPGPAAGLFGSVRALLATLVAIGHTRLELLSVEIQEEVERVAGLLVWSIAALLIGLAALLMLSAAVVLWVEPPHRWMAAGLLALVFLCGCGGAALKARSRVTRKPRPLDATLSELEKDHDMLKG
jgi:uncharacterized membrane protein YqjE